MTPSDSGLDAGTRVLVQLSAAIAAGDEATVRSWFVQAAREWRRVSGQPAPASDEAEDMSRGEEWRERGEQTCAAVYDGMYEKLRLNVRDLHPALDAWMVVDGYGKVLSRPGLDLSRRELCIVAACAAMGQDRQLHSHLRGALNVGVDPAVLGEVLEAIESLVGPERTRSARLLLARIRGK